MNQLGMRVFNIGLGQSYSVREILTVAGRVTGRAIPSRIAGRRPGDPAVLCANPNRLIHELGWKPEHSSLQEIIQSAWQWKLQRKKSLAGTSAR
jgi:UDP-glucose 4-epimerase